MTSGDEAELDDEVELDDDSRFDNATRRTFLKGAGLVPVSASMLGDGQGPLNQQTSNSK